jgi:hypothetical protein
MEVEAAWSRFRVPNKTEYIAALRRINLTAKRRQMLQVHILAPNHSITMIEMSKKVWGQHYPQSPANLHYGKLAGELSGAAGISLPAGAPNLCAIGTFRNDPSGAIPLTMHSTLVDALIEFGLR